MKQNNDLNTEKNDSLNINEIRQKTSFSGRFGKLLLAAGVIFILAALSLAGWNAWSVSRDESSAEKALTVLEEEIRSRSGETHLEHQLVPEKEMPVVQVEGTEYCGILEIPALEFVQPVKNQWTGGSSPIICRYSGKAYLPDFILGAPAGEVLLPALTAEGLDQIVFTDLFGNEFQYRVADRFTIYDYQFDTLDSLNADLILMAPAQDQWQIVLAQKI